MCQGVRLQRFLDLGLHPPSDAFLTREELSSKEPKYPLDVLLCEECGLVQLGFVVPPELMFNDQYVYYTGVSKTMDAHLGEFARDLAKRHAVAGELVVDIGSNDGTFLKHFKKAGAKTLGVDPSASATAAIQSGIETVKKFFGEDVGKIILRDRGPAEVITAVNVFAHVDDLNDFMRGIRLLLSDKGLFVIESPYLPDLIRSLEFDTIYHEHLSYLSVKPMMLFFNKYGMSILDVKRTRIHGGSIRVFVAKNNGEKQIGVNVKRLLRHEEELRMDKIATFLEFAQKVETLKKDLVTLLRRIKREGDRIVGNGAAAKGNTLINYCGIGKETLDYIADPNPVKHGMFTPGSHIPVVGIEELRTDTPDYMLILAWNLKEKIMEQEAEFAGGGGKFIVPLPKPVIVERRIMR